MEITVEQMYNIENKGHDMGFLKKFMMENAGAAAVRRLIEKFGNVESKNILIFAGLGNNGGDGLVMARHLAGHTASVTVLLLGTPDKIKTEESSWNWSGVPRSNTITFAAWPARCRAITKPSPPLFPNPTKINMFLDSTSPNFSINLLTAAAPAFSIINFFKNPIS